MHWVALIQGTVLCAGVSVLEEVTVKIEQDSGEVEQRREPRVALVDATGSLSVLHYHVCFP